MVAGAWESGPDQRHVGKLRFGLQLEILLIVEAVGLWDERSLLVPGSCAHLVILPPLRFWV
jgi:hypothetical protein